MTMDFMVALVYDDHYQNYCMKGWNTSWQNTITTATIKTECTRYDFVKVRLSQRRKEERSYYQLVIDVEIDGDEAELVFKCPADKALLLKAAASIPDNFLDDNDNRR